MNSVSQVEVHEFELGPSNQNPAIELWGGLKIWPVVLRGSTTCSDGQFQKSLSLFMMLETFLELTITTCGATS